MAGGAFENENENNVNTETDGGVSNESTEAVDQGEGGAFGGEGSKTTAKTETGIDAGAVEQGEGGAFGDNSSSTTLEVNTGVNDLEGVVTEQGEGGAFSDGGNTSIDVGSIVGQGGGFLLVSGNQASTSGSPVFLETILNDVMYRAAFYQPQYPNFSLGISGAPSNSSVFTTQGSFTVTGSASSGTLSSIETISTSEGSGVIVDNAATFSGSAYQPEGNYTATVTALGLSGHPTPLSQQKSASSSWNRFVPAYWTTGSTTPTALPDAATGVNFGSKTISGTTGSKIFLITTQSGFRFNNQGFEIIESLKGTIEDQSDTASISRDFNVYQMGTVGASGSASFTLV